MHRRRAKGVLLGQWRVFEELTAAETNAAARVDPVSPCSRRLAYRRSLTSIMAYISRPGIRNLGRVAGDTPSFQREFPPQSQAPLN